MNVCETLPVHVPGNQETRPEDETGGLEVCGLVEWARVLSAAELAALPRIRRAERFVCEEGVGRRASDVRRNPAARSARGFLSAATGSFRARVRWIVLARALAW